VFPGCQKFSVASGYFVCYSVVGGVIHALKSLGKRALQDQDSEVIYQGNAEFYPT
jgi:hypothetical protein